MGVPSSLVYCSAKDPSKGVYFMMIPMNPSANSRTAVVSVSKVDVSELYVPGMISGMNCLKNLMETGVTSR